MAWCKTNVPGLNAWISALGAYLIFLGESQGHWFEGGTYFVYQFLASKWHYPYF